MDQASPANPPRNLGSRAADPGKEHLRLPVLDGWRGLSILFVLAGHLLPLGPKWMGLNDMAGPVGMALFFTLSGFLITSFLLRDPHAGEFLVRRLARVVPAAWLTITVVLLMEPASWQTWIANLFFYSNLPPQHLVSAGSHLWSLCVEMQFYLSIAVIVAAFGRRGLYAIPVMCLAVTVHRIWVGIPVDIVTIRRVDEILAGGILALIFHEHAQSRLAHWLSRSNPFVFMLLFLISCHPQSGFMNYLRPYLAAWLVGSTLYAPPAVLRNFLTQRWLVYVAAVSYALYLYHHVFIHTWLGQGSSKVMVYLKRPLLFLATFAAAHFSTFYFEKHFNQWGAIWGKKLRRNVGLEAPGKS